MLKIKNVELENPFIFAPLAGITDAPTRSIARHMGAALVYSEMISSKGLMYESPNTSRLLEIYPDEKPVAYQLFGAEPEIMAAAAEKLAPLENAVLDINMGCPVQKVVKNGEGSALMKNPDLAGRIVEAAVKGNERGGAAGKPVTVKIRAGWNKRSVNAPEIAKTAEAAGASAVAVHGRTRDGFYTGTANWGIIAAVKKAVSVPVIGSGDVFSAEDAIRMLDETGCDLVMIARGALGNPWIFREVKALWQGGEKPLPPSIREKAGMMIYHLDMLAAAKGEYTAVREMRKHIGWYMKGERGAAEIRRRANAASSVQEIKEMIAGFAGV